jgi:hypothetical protein
MQRVLCSLVLRSTRLFPKRNTSEDGSFDGLTWRCDVLRCIPQSCGFKETISVSADFDETTLRVGSDGWREYMIELGSSSREQTVSTMSPCRVLRANTLEIRRLLSNALVLPWRNPAHPAGQSTPGKAVSNSCLSKHSCRQSPIHLTSQPSARPYKTPVTKSNSS